MRATWLYRVTRLGIIGLAMISLTACYGMSGFFGDYLAGADASQSTGANRSMDGDGMGWGECLSATNIPIACGSGGHVKTVYVRGDSSWDGDWTSVRQVETYYTIHPRVGSAYGQGHCDGFDPAYCGLFLGSSPKSGRDKDGNKVTLSYTVSDTSGGGVVSAGDFTCVTFGHIAYGGVPDLFNDETDCRSLYSPAPGLSSAVQAGIDGVTIGIVANDPNGNNSRISKLPLELKIDLMNSIDLSKDVRVVTNTNGTKSEWVRFYVTDVRIGGDVYRPVNVYADVIDFERFMFSSGTPGYKLTAAWIANKLQGLVDRGATNVRGWVTLNDSVTVTFQQFAEMTGARFMPEVPTQTQIDHLRHLATNNIRD